MKNLISMTDYIIQQHEQCISSTGRTYNYAKFLKQLLELWMFVPCDEDGNVLEHPNYIKGQRTAQFYNDKMDLYQQAKERCLFEGFEWNVAEFCDEPMYELEDKKGNYFCYDCEDKNFSKDEEFFCSNIEDILKYDLQLTQTAIKQLGL